MKCLLLCLLALMSVVSCVSTGGSGTAIHPDDLQLLSNRTLAVIPSKPSRLQVMKPTDAFGGALGGLAKAFSGDNLGPADPAAGVAGILANELARQRGLKVMPSSNTPTLNRASVPEIVKSARSADYALNVSTTSAMVIYKPTNWRRYHLTACLKMLLVDTHTGRVLASGLYYQNDTSPNATTTSYDGIFANDASFVRQELNTIGNLAQTHFMRNILRL